MNPQIKNRLLDIAVGSLAVLAGLVTNFIGERLLGVRLELYAGVATFSPLWVVTLFLLPVVAGIVVSTIYGVGGKMLAFIPPLILQVYNYLDTLYYNPPVNAMQVLPFIYWVLLVVVAMEFCGIGGFIGEVIWKKTYGRSAQHKLHKKYQNAPIQDSGEGTKAPSSSDAK